MSSLYAYLHIILLIFNNMIKNIGPDGDSVYFSASKQYQQQSNLTGHTKMCINMLLSSILNFIDNILPQEN